MSLKLAFIGAGNMARSIIGGLVEDGFSTEDIHVSSRSSDKLNSLKADFNIQIQTDNQAAAEQADIIIIAVKPQQLRQVINEISTVWQPHQLLVSVAAGIRLQSIEQWLNQDKPLLVRAMPNTPALIKAGATGVFANANVPEQQRQQVTSLLAATGAVVWIPSESQMDAVTALSGSGPAYFFLVMEAMQKAAIELGLPDSVAKELTLHTALGAAKMAESSTLNVSELRQQVTSPGGTTEQAIDTFKKGQLLDLFAQAMQAANDRANALAMQLGQDDDQ